MSGAAGVEWRDVLLRVKNDAKADNLSLLAGGIAFFSLLALVPALVAIVSIYGLVADPSDVERQARNLTRGVPQEVRDLLVQQLRNIVDTSGQGLGLAAVGGIVLALWSASSAVKHLLAAVSTASGEKEGRGFVKLRGISFLLALGGAGFVVVSVALIAVLPSVLGDTELGDGARFVFNIVRWPLLFAAMIVALSVVYRVGADRGDAEWRWVSPGAVLATLGWIIVSALFSIYTASIGKYNETYGSLGAVIVLMLWLYLSALLILIGAEVNAEIEHRTEPVEPSPRT